MQMDTGAYERARLARDPRFDGRFFIGVTSTGIYCRPICPAPSPKPKNVRYYPSAAAAAEAGFRPCLRCRPEASPGTPAWLGASASVSRALKLIGESALDDGGVDRLWRSGSAWARGTCGGCSCGIWARRRSRWRRPGAYTSRKS